jgi:hypothetical protein
MKTEVLSGHPTDGLSHKHNHKDFDDYGSGDEDDDVAKDYLVVRDAQVDQLHTLLNLISRDV